MDELIRKLEAMLDNAEETDDGERMSDDPDLRCVFVDMRPDDFHDLIVQAAAELRRVREAQTTWEVHVNDEWMAGSDDFSDAMHYAAMYESEGTVTVYRVTRSLVPERGEVGS